MIIANIAFLTSSPTESIKEINNIFLELGDFNHIIALTAAVLLLYGVSEMYVILGLKQYIDRLYFSANPFIKRLIVLFSSSLLSNIFLEDQEFFSVNKKEMNSSSFITSTLNVVSLVTISIFILFSFLFEYHSDFTIVFFIIIIGNFFALNWIIKRVIDFYYSKEVHYDYHSQSLIKVNASKHNLHLHGSPLSKITHLYILCFGFIGTLLLITIFNINSFIYSSLIFLSFLFLTLFLIIEYQIYKKNKIKEVDFYHQILSSYKNIFTFFIDLGMAVLFLKSNLLLLQNHVLIEFNKILLLLLLVFLSTIVTYLFKNYLLTLNLFFPLIFLNFDHYVIILLFFVSFTYYIYFLSTIHLALNDWKLWKEILLIIFLSCIQYLIYFIYNSYLLVFVLFFIFSISYTLYSKFIFKEPNGN